MFIQDLFSSFSNWSIFWGWFFSDFIFSSSIDHRFSIGLRSGEFGGHSSFPQKLIWWSWSHWRLVEAVWQRAPSCINVISDFIFAPPCFILNNLKIAYIRTLKLLHFFNIIVVNKFCQTNFFLLMALFFTNIEPKQSDALLSLHPILVYVLDSILQD